MTSARLYRISGIGLLLGGLLALIGTLIQGVNDNPLGPAWVPSVALALVGEMLLLAGLPGMYARQSNRAGTLGLVGFILFFLSGLMQGVGGSVINLFIPALAATGCAQTGGPGTS